MPLGDKLTELCDRLSSTSGLTVYPSVPPQDAWPPYAYIMPGTMLPGPRTGTYVLQAFVAVVAEPSGEAWEMVAGVYDGVGKILDRSIRGQSEWAVSSAEGVAPPEKYGTGTNATLAAVIFLERVVSREDLTPEPETGP